MTKLSEVQEDPTLSRRDGSSNATDRAYDSLRSMILHRGFRPGEVVEERRLAEKFNVSRTPLRAAVSRLIGENLLTRLSNGTLVVQSLTLEDFFEMIHIRKLLESEAAALAAGRIPAATIEELRQSITAFESTKAPDVEKHWELDDKFHQVIAAASNNKSLERIINDVRSRARLCNIGKNPARSHETCQEHLAILNALADGDSDLARQRMTEHIDGVRKGFLALLGVKPT